MEGTTWPADRHEDCFNGFETTFLTRDGEFYQDFQLNQIGPNSVSAESMFYFKRLRKCTGTCSTSHVCIDERNLLCSWCFHNCRALRRKWFLQHQTGRLVYGLLTHLRQGGWTCSYDLGFLEIYRLSNIPLCIAYLGSAKKEFFRTRFICLYIFLTLYRPILDL